MEIFRGQKLGRRRKSGQTFQTIKAKITNVQISKQFTMKKLFFICLMATAILALDSCRKDPIYIDDNGNVIDGNRKPIASFTYTTQQITGGLAIKCNNTSSYATSYEWNFNGSTSYQTNPTFYVYSAGTYYLSLTAYNDNGSDYAYKTITVTAAPTGYEITSLTLTKIPMVDGNNESWDTGLEGGAAPDIFFKILDENASITYYTSSIINSVTSSALPVSWTVPNLQLEIGTTYKIRFIDDDDFTSDDVMANCVWQIKSTQEGQTTINWNAQNGTISFVVGIKWLYPSKDSEELICIEEGPDKIIGEIE